MTSAGALAPHDHMHCISDALQRAEALCEQRGVRLTPTRRRVLELVWDSHAPIGAYAILDQLKVNDRTAAPPTVYRALDFLLEQGLIHRLESLNAFIGCDHPEDRHISQFLICTECRQAIEVADKRIVQAATTCAQDQGFSLSRITLEIEGTCARCSVRLGDAVRSQG
jgi:Fur family zinc uptake transcriptional regulator